MYDRIIGRDRTYMKLQRDTLVGEFRKELNARESLVLRADTSLADAAQSLKDRPEVDLIAVTDEQDVLVGTLTVDVLLGDIIADIVPESYFSDASTLEGLLTSAPLLSVHRTIGEITSDAFAVTDDTTAEGALIELHRNNLRAIPIVDDSNRIIGQLTLIELVLRWMNDSPDYANDE